MVDVMMCAYFKLGWRGKDVFICFKWFDLSVMKCLKGPCQDKDVVFEQFKHLPDARILPWISPG